MKYESSRLRALATSSQRLNKMLLLLTSLALLLVSMSYWAVGRVFEEESDKVDFHFARLIESIHEHESFLKLAAQGYSRAHQNVVTYVQPFSNKLIMLGDDEEVYQVKGLAMSIPFTLAKRNEYSDEAMRGALSWGVQLTDFYSSFWASSFYSSPQLFMFSPSPQFNVAIPGVGSSRRQLLLEKSNFFEVTQSLYTKLAAERNKLSETHVGWMRAPHGLFQDTKTIVGYIGIDLTNEVMPSGKDQGLSILTALLDASEINELERLLVRPINNRFTLISPEGDVLLGEPSRVDDVSDGFSLDRYGLCFKLKSAGENPWVGLYSISYENFFRYALWPLLGVIGLFSLLLMVGWRITRWFRTRIVEPAERANQSLIESEAFNRVILENAPVALCVVQRNNNQVLIENQRAMEWQCTAEMINVLKLDRRANIQGEMHMEVAGRYLQVCFVSTRYKGEDVVLCGFNDITRHIDQTNLLNKARRSADEASQAKTLFLATMSHEIRTPLYGLLGNLELLGLTDLNKRQRDYLSTIERSSSVLFQLISDVLDVSRIESGQMSVESVTFCPLDLFEDCIRAYSAAATNKGLKIYACADGTLPALMLGDPGRIRQIINNLLSNAIKFTESGQIVLRVKVVEQDDTHASLQWQVSDTGVGISEKALANLFTPFNQLSANNIAGGAGLGLSICSRLSELMGASLRVVSEPGLGSSFSLNIRLPIIPGELPDCRDIDIQGMPVRVLAPLKELEQSLIDWLNRWGAYALPATQEAVDDPTFTLLEVTTQATGAVAHSERVIIRGASPDKDSNSPQILEINSYDIRAIGRGLTLIFQGARPTKRLEHTLAPVRIGLRILVAEDNPINQAILREQLEALGAEVSTADNGEQAFKLWNALDFDLVITDVNMPFMNGYELAQALRQQGADIPILGVTANAFREEGKLCLAAGMNAWVVKPLTLKQLRETLTTWCPTDAATAQAPSALQPGDMDNWITLSAQMRQLFIDTMNEDLLNTERALHAKDVQGLVRHLHRMNGSLASVRAQALCAACNHLEFTLHSHPLTDDTRRELVAFMSRLRAALLILSEDLIT